MKKIFQLLVCVISISTIYCQCSTMDPEILQRRRLQNLRAGILNQLGLTEEDATAPINSTEPSREIVEAYNVLVEARTSLREENKRKCQLSSDELFAQPITTFVGRARQTKSKLALCKQWSCHFTYSSLIFRFTNTIDRQH